MPSARATAALKSGRVTALSATHWAAVNTTGFQPATRDTPSEDVGMVPANTSDFADFRIAFTFYIQFRTALSHTRLKLRNLEQIHAENGAPIWREPSRQVK
jgi:hypothetical protein